MSIPTFASFLKNSDLQSSSLINPSYTKDDFTPLNLSASNKELQDLDLSSSDILRDFIWKHMSTQNAKVAFGGYLEKRGIYKRSDYFNQTDLEMERNIHLGLDIWMEEDSRIYAPLNGTIHSFKNNTNFGDYGPTIILQHSVGDYVFYSLYGHLSKISLENISIGQSIKKGQGIATLGNANVNGDYPPHLHFQLIKDIEAYFGDYPGVCCKSDLPFYSQNCPDPNILLKLY